MRKYLYDFSKDIDNLDLMLAHLSKDENKRHETLLEHSDLVFDKVIAFNNHNNFISNVKSLISNIIDTLDLYINNSKVEDFILKLFLNAIYLHDIGKVSIGYQYSVLNNYIFKDEYLFEMTDVHSPFSTRIYLDYTCEELFNKHSKELKSKSEDGLMFLLNIIIQFAYCIQKHHSYLSCYESFDEILKEEDAMSGKLIFKEACKYSELKHYKKNSNLSKVVLNADMKRIQHISNKVSRELFLLNKILFSTLVAADSIATSEYMNSTKLELKKLDILSLMQAYRNTPVYKNIQEHLKNNIFEGTINSVRCDIFKEADDNIIRNIDKNIFYLESPTGSGKTNLSMNIAFKNVELSQDTTKPLQRIIYTAPFNTVVNQTSKALNSLFKDCNAVDIVEVNSTTKIKTKKISDKIDYDLSLLDYQMLNYPLTLTSHVKLFSILFGNSRLEAESLIHLFNSVIIIDEIQAYKIDVWSKMINLFDVYAKYMNIKFIIMSATLPKIGDLLCSENIKSSYCSLINDSSKYFNNKFFKDRINCYNFDLLSDDIRHMKKTLDYDIYKSFLFDKILNKISKIYRDNSESKVLIEFITKKSCRDFYNFIKDYNNRIPLKESGVVIRELTSDDNSYFKEKTIKEVTTLDSIILVSTQCIEAGVDINMDYGFKDISYIDNEEQFLGRIRREYDESKYSEAVFFDLDEEDDIYCKTSFNYKKGLNVLSEDYREILKSKNFSKMFDELLACINDNLNSYNDKVSRRNFELLLTKLDYGSIYKDLELISSKNEYTIYIPFNIEIFNEETKKSVFYNGKETWSEFEKILKEPEYSKKMVAISHILPKLSLFSYKYKNNNICGDFKEFLRSKNISFKECKDIYCLDLSKSDILKFVDEDYKFNKDMFDNYIANISNFNNNICI